MTKVRLILLVVVFGLLAMAGCRSAHTTSAILYIEEQNYEKAVAVLQEGFAFQDDEPDAYYYLGEAYTNLAVVAVEENNYLEAKKNYELSYESYCRAKEIDPENFSEMANIAIRNNFTYRNNDGRRDFGEENYEEAEGYFRLAYAARPDTLGSIRNIARLKIQHSNSVVSEDPEHSHQLLGEALELLDQVLAANPDIYDLQADKASVLKHLGRATEADAIYSRLMIEHGDDPILLSAIAELASDEEDYERAADLYVQIADIYENDSNAETDQQIKALLFTAGSWLGSKRIGRFEDAIELLNRASNRELFPEEGTLLVRSRTHLNYGEHLENLAAAETDPVQKAEIEQQTQQILQLGVNIGVALIDQYPGCSEGFLILSQCQYKLGDYTAADINLKAYEELISGVGDGTP